MNKSKEVRVVNTVKLKDHSWSKTVLSAEDIINKFGYDWSNIDIEDMVVTISGADFSKITLPADTEFFQKIINKYIELCNFGNKDYRTYNFKDVNFYKCEFGADSLFSESFFTDIKVNAIWHLTLPGMDYTRHDFSHVNLYKCVFPPQSIFPKNVFQKANRNAFNGCVLPEMDYRDFDFHMVSMHGVIFPYNAKLPENKNFFQNLYNKTAYEWELPFGDYSHYNFTDVTIMNTKFTSDSIVPLDILTKIRTVSSRFNRWPLHLIEDVLLYDLPDEGSFNFENASGNEKLTRLLKAKYKNNSRVILPV